MNATFDVTRFTPHGFCLAWDPQVLAMTIIGNGAIGLAYMIIPMQLLYMLLNSTGTISLTRDRTMMSLFASFIFLCGGSHFLELMTIWFPIYQVLSYWLLATAIVSMTTAAMTQFLFLKPPADAEHATP